MPHLLRATLAASLVCASILGPSPSALARGENGPLPRATNAFFVNAATGNDGNACQSAASACRTIAAAVAKSGGQGTINVAAGTYSENLTLGNVNLAIAGAGSGATAIDGGLNGRVIVWQPSSSGGSALSLSGLAIQNGATAANGAGLYASGRGVLTLSGVVFAANNCLASSASSTCLGGGVYADIDLLTASDVAFTANNADFGGGLFFTPGNVNVQSTLTRVTFSNNGGGGALYLLNAAPGVSPATLGLTGVTFSGNGGSPANDLVLCNAAFTASDVTFSGTGGADVSTDPGMSPGPCS